MTASQAAEEARSFDTKRRDLERRIAVARATSDSLEASARRAKSGTRAR